jgi:hypothetical protein
MGLESAMDEGEALKELHDLLTICCEEHGPARYLPPRYQICRASVMNSRLSPYLPGFVRQCVSLFKFRDFICLYDHDPAVRTKFVEEAMASCWTQLNEATPRRSADPDDFF